MNEPALDAERDLELLRRIARGDRSAFAKFYDLYSGRLFAIAVKILSDAKEAEDVLQEVFRQIWNEAGAGHPQPGHPVNWVVTFTRNQALDRIRASPRRAKRIAQAEEAAVQLSRDALDSSLPQITPPLALRQRILEQVKPAGKVFRPPSPTMGRLNGWMSWLPWALAVCLVIVCVISLSQQKNLRQKVGVQASQLFDLNQLADSLRNQTQDLKQTVATWQETNRLTGLRIAMLNSRLEDSPKAVAVSLWDEQQQLGVFLVQNLKPLPADKDYQLWVIDAKYPAPVSAGVFQVDERGTVRLQFKTDKLIENAGKFAVTQEPKGGLPTPTLKNLVLIGG